MTYPVIISVIILASFTGEMIVDAWGSTLFLPQEIVNLVKYQDTLVPISGEIGKAAGNSIVSITVQTPTGTTSNFSFIANEDGKFHGFYTIPGYKDEKLQRESEGRYTVSGSYKLYDKGDIVRSGGIGSGNFVAQFDSRHDHTIEIISDGTKDCKDVGKCYKGSIMRVDLGDSIEWYNKSGTPHLIKSTENSEHVFNIGIVAPNHFKSHVFDTAGSIEYTCSFHPWMVGTITVFEAGDKRVVPVVPKQTMIIDGDMEWHNGGDRMSIKVHFIGTDSKTATVTLIDSKGVTVLESTVKRENDIGHLQVLSQPTWGPGEYKLVIKAPNHLVEKTATITQHPIKCIEIEGESASCFAGLVDQIIDHDTIKVDGVEANLTVSRMEPGEESQGILSKMCPRGSVAIVDPDEWLNDTMDALSWQDATYAVYCNGNPVSVNERLLIDGTAKIDPARCLTTEFEWGQCDAQTAITVTVEDVMGDITNDITKDSPQDTENIRDITDLTNLTADAIDVKDVADISSGIVGEISEMDYTYVIVAIVGAILAVLLLKFRFNDRYNNLVFGIVDIVHTVTLSQPKHVDKAKLEVRVRKENKPKKRFGFGKSVKV